MLRYNASAASLLIFLFALAAISCGGSAQRTQAPALKCNLPTILNTLCDNKVNSQLWYWDSVSGKCDKRAAGAVSCDGFATKLECLHSCTCRQPLNTGSECPTPATNATANNNATTAAVMEQQQRWWYESHVEKCMPFNFTGCGGNVNNFINESSCNHACQPPRGLIGARIVDLRSIVDRQIKRNLQEQNQRRAALILSEQQDQFTTTPTSNTEAPVTSSTTERTRESKIRVRQRSSSNDTLLSIANIDQRLQPLINRPHKRVAIGIAPASTNN